MGLKLTCCCAAATLLLLSGCESPPKSRYSSARQDISSTTSGERGARQILPTGWIEFSDIASRQLVADLSELPEFNGEYRSTIILGSIENKTGVVSTSEFEQFRARFRGQLVNSRSFTDRAVFRSNRRQMEEIRRREMPEQEDLLQEGRGRSSMKAINPDYTYELRGEMYATHRSDSALYSLSLQLYNFSSGELVWQNIPYDLKQTVRR